MSCVGTDSDQMSDARPPMEPASRRTWRAILAVVASVCAVSIGGGFALGVVLVPALVWLARGASGAVAAGFAVLAAILTAEVSWVALYLILGDNEPLIWAAPSMLALVAAVVVLTAWRRSRVERPVGARV